MADEEQCAARGGALARQQIKESTLPFGIERRGRFVSNDDLGAPDQCPCRCNPLLLADAQAGDLPLVQRLLQIEVRQQTPGLVMQ